MIACPKCGSQNYERDEVDVGVGSIAAGPYGCFDCGYVEQVEAAAWLSVPVQAEARLRRTYRFIVSTSIEVDDERTADVQRLVQEQINAMYARMEREDDIRIVLQHQCAVVETP